MMVKKITAIAIAVMFVGCASVAEYKPVLNAKADKNAANAQVDFDYCRTLAAQTAGWTVDSIGDAFALGSGASAVGAISGATITGAVSAGTGALIGAGIGGVAGLWYGMYDANETYKRSYNSCMSQLGHTILW